MRVYTFVRLSLLYKYIIYNNNNMRWEKSFKRDFVIIPLGNICSDVFYTSGRDSSEI